MCFYPKAWLMLCTFFPKSINMASALDKWNPRVGDKPDYYDTVKFVYKHIEFHISEDEAYAILNAFIGKWDKSLGLILSEEELTGHVMHQLLQHREVALPKAKVRRIVQLILGYLQVTGHYCQLELQAAR
jgi:hypothetical protein